MDFKTLKLGVVVLGGFLLAMITFYATLMIGGLVVGTVANTATSGDIDVSSAMNTSLAGVEGDYITNSEALSNNIPLVVGLIAVVLIVLVFFGSKFNLMGGGNKGGMN